MKIVNVLIGLLLSNGVEALWNGNINYRSPSLLHPGLGIDVPKVQKRTIQPSTTALYWNSNELNFTHGVASGDPYPGSVILWTRISPTIASDKSNITVEGTAEFYSHETEKYIKAASAKLACVKYAVSTSNDMSNPVDTGTAYTTSDIDFTVKVEAKNLKPWTVYYYQFTVCDSSKKSSVGRTKTSPREDDSVTGVKFAVYSCSQYQNGYFNAYGNPARKDSVDFVIHLGDYIYENSKGVVGKDPRATLPSREIVTLYDYRTRIGQYRTDPDLLLSHQKFAWISTWDDHEVANNGYRDGFSNMNNTEQSFLKFGVSVDQRKMNAVRAYFEWMPIRQVELDDNLRIWRSFSMGKLLDLVMLDTRNYDRSITTLVGNEEYIYDISNDAGRSLMGSRQENWFYRQLSKSQSRGATWRIVGNQIVFSRINITSWFGTFENPYNGDQWDGYQANRNRTLAHLYKNGIGNNIFLAGDSHANWVSDLAWVGHEDYNASSGSNSIGAEFAGTAVTSSGFGGTIASANKQASTLVRDNEELKWNEGYYRGYYELYVTPESVKARYFGIPTVAQRTPFELPLANFTVNAGENRLQRPIGGGKVVSGAISEGTVSGSNLTYNTENKTWVTTSYDSMFIAYAS